MPTRFLQLKLSGRIIAITRSEREAQEFSLLVQSEGGKAIALPTIEIVPESPTIVTEFLANVNEKKHDYCAFVSAQAVNVMFDLADKIGCKSQVERTLNNIATMAVGPKTMKALEEHGVKVTAVPDKFSSLGLAEYLSRTKNALGKKIIIPRSRMANDSASSSLSDLGMKVDEIFLYTVRTAVPNASWIEFCDLLYQQKIDAIVFTSASNVTSFFEIMDGITKSETARPAHLPSAISIGPFTSRELEKRKIKHFEAKNHTVLGTFDMAVAILSPKVR